jgi:hypothetical protein
MEAGWAPSAVWTFAEVSIAAAVIRTPDDPVCSLDTTLTFNNIENGMAYTENVLHIKHAKHVSRAGG